MLGEYWGHKIRDTKIRDTGTSYYFALREFGYVALMPCCPYVYNSYVYYSYMCIGVTFGCGRWCTQKWAVFVRA